MIFKNFTKLKWFLIFGIMLIIICPTLIFVISKNEIMVKIGLVFFMMIILYPILDQLKESVEIFNDIRFIIKNIENWDKNNYRMPQKVFDSYKESCHFIYDETVYIKLIGNNYIIISRQDKFFKFYEIHYKLNSKIYQYLKLRAI